MCVEHGTTSHLLGCVWFYRKIASGKESEWMDPLSIVCYHLKEERKESFNWDPQPKTFRNNEGRKVRETTTFE